MKRPVTLLIGLYVLIYALILLFTSYQSKAQFFGVVNDCCSQAIDLQKQVDGVKAELKVVTTDRDTLRAVSKRLITAKDKRLSMMGTQLTLTSDSVKTFRKSLVKSDSTKAVLQEKVYQYEGRTWAGQQLRKVGKSAKVVGWAALVYSVLKVFISR